MEKAVEALEFALKEVERELLSSNDWAENCERNLKSARVQIAELEERKTHLQAGINKLQP